MSSRQLLCGKVGRPSAFSRTNSPRGANPSRGGGSQQVRANGVAAPKLKEGDAEKGLGETRTNALLPQPETGKSVAFAISLAPG
jgi:hypothetical protein